MKLLTQADKFDKLSTLQKRMVLLKICIKHKIPMGEMRDSFISASIGEPV